MGFLGKGFKNVFKYIYKVVVRYKGKGIGFGVKIGF